MTKIVLFTSILIVSPDTTNRSDGDADKGEEMEIESQEQYIVRSPHKDKHYVDTCSSPMFKTDITIDDILNAPVSDPLKPIEQKILTTLVKRVLFQRNDGTVQCKTGGPALTLVHVPKCRVDSTACSSRTMRRRSKKAEDVLNVTSGTKPDSVATQLGYGVKRLNKDCKETFFEKAGINIKKMDALTACAMKESSNITWAQLKKQRRFLKECGFVMPSESTLRETMISIAPTEIESTMEVFFTKDGHPISAAFARVPNITKLIKDMLHKYDKENKLTRHEFTIPEDQMWIKFGGDHGKGSMKYTMQVVNTEKPNSKHNTFVIGITETKDNNKNIAKCMSFLKPQLDELSNADWRGKKIVLFIFGDYEFQTKLYGLSGPNGMFPCLWCNASKEDIHNGKPSSERSLDGIISEHQRFLEEGKGKKKNVMDYKNCLRSPLIDIDISAVTPPYLHILLGITLKHHRLLEAEVHELDRQLCDQPKLGGCYEGYPLHTSHGDNWSKAREIKASIAEKASLTFWIENEIQDQGPEEQTSLKAWLTKLNWDIGGLENDLLGMKYKPLSKRNGPLCSGLDKILEDNGIIPQAYHSRSFIGNHCHKYLIHDTESGPPVYEKLTSYIVTTVAECTENVALHTHAQGIKTKYDALNRVYMDVHKAISHCKPILSDEVPDIERSITTYMAIFRSAFQDVAVIPKQHILEMHCVPWIKKYKFGLGLLGEQGGELIHSSVAQLNRRSRAIRNAKARLKLIMQTQHLQCTPELLSLEPKIKTRIKKRKTRISRISD